MGNSVFLSGMQDGETLEKFLDRVVRPDTSFLSRSNQVIDTVVRLLHQKIPYSVDHIVKGGSLGKGTGVRNRSDVDLLVVLNDFKTIGGLKNNLPKILSTIEDVLRNTLPGSLPGADVQVIGTTPFTLQFRLRCYGHYEWFDVDLLPIIDVPRYGMYGEMGYGSKDGDFYAKCLAKLQVEFIKPLPPKAKDLIRLLKYWKKVEGVNISSYGIELLVKHVWEKQGRKENFSLKSLMSSVVKELVSYRQLRICWNKHYNADTYCRSMTVPYILDPANPYNNLAWDDYSYLHGGSTIERKGKELQRRLGGLRDEGRICRLFCRLLGFVFICFLAVFIYFLQTTDHYILVLN